MSIQLGFKVSLFSPQVELVFDLFEMVRVDGVDADEVDFFDEFLFS